MHGKVLSSFYHGTVIFEQFFSSKVHIPANVFHEITGVNDALKKNAHDENEQTISPYSFAIFFFDSEQSALDLFIKNKYEY